MYIHPTDLINIDTQRRAELLAAAERRRFIATHRTRRFDRLRRLRRRVPTGPARAPSRPGLAAELAHRQC